ncbi:3'-5' exonuclease [Brevundimonas sp.]|uniref:3'-5' exonuclease n=1 Tax=Brevundimonas sp. TaxID=1871086 RepID=UPI002869FBB1|nr:3'-5' exonuclease [Brevundimonas sp.]
MLEARFALKPGWVRSRHDGQSHYIGVSRLQRLYGLQCGEFVHLLPCHHPTHLDFLARGRIVLGPREDGLYAAAKTEAVIAHAQTRLTQIDRSLRGLESRHRKPRRRSHVMVDLETMGTTPGSAIVSIGATVFDPVEGTIGEQLYVPIKLSSCASWGLTEDPATRKWWAGQSPEAQAVLTDPDQVTLTTALDRFDAFWRQVGGSEFWAHGPNFDDPILAAAYRAVRRRPPWSFWNARCTRTVYAAARIAPNRAKGVHHNALQDAVNQAEAVIEGFRILGLGRRPLAWTLRRIWRRIVEGRS